MAHTEGPWGYDPETHHIVSTVAAEEWSVDLEDDPPVPKRVVCLYSAMGGDDSRSDTALMVAAPELLAMVGKLVEATSGDARLNALRAEAADIVTRATDATLMKIV